MARKKLQRFEENKGLSHVIEPGREDILKAFPLQGNWKKDFFKNNNPLVLELGCGKGEYTVAMAEEYPGKNFIGIDIKGSRIWYGATEVAEKKITNAAFLRIQAELIHHCFAENEIDEIWITFPDPQIKHKRAKHRLTHPQMLNRYRSILHKDGLVHLKTDSEFLHGYTLGVLEISKNPIHEAWYDIDKQVQNTKNMLHSVKTHYEEIFRKKGKPITYIKFGFNEEGQLL